ncbi:MAG: hypothetical protein MHMPM18_003640, partial [Marteilia pararefringens]
MDDVEDLRVFKAFDDYDKWLFDSVDLYENLHIFHPPKTIEKMAILDEKNLLALNDDRSEISILSIPHASKSMQVNFDLDIIYGVRCNSKLRHFTTFHSTSAHFISNHEDNTVRKWSKDSESMMLKCTAVFQPAARVDCLDTLGTNTSKIIALHPEELSLIDLDGKSSSRILDLKSTDYSKRTHFFNLYQMNISFICHTNSSITICDINSGKIIGQTAKASEKFRFHFSNSPDDNKWLGMCINNLGVVYHCDYRIKELQKVGHLVNFFNEPPTSKKPSKIRANCLTDTFCIFNDNSPLIPVYDAKMVRSKPIFEHEGHRFDQLRNDTNFKITDVVWKKPLE